MHAAIWICFLTADGEERDERWPSVEAFRTWAQAEGLACTWSAYREDDEGERLLMTRGRIMPPAAAQDPS